MTENSGTAAPSELDVLREDNEILRKRLKAAHREIQRLELSIEGHVSAVTEKLSSSYAKPKLVNGDKWGDSEFTAEFDIHPLTCKLLLVPRPKFEKWGKDYKLAYKQNLTADFGHAVADVLHELLFGKRW